MFRDRQKALKRLEEQLQEEEEEYEEECWEDEDWDEDEEMPRKRRGRFLWFLLVIAGLLALGYFLFKEGLLCTLLQ